MVGKLELPKIDLVAVLEEKGVIAKFLEGVNSLIDRGHTPNPDQAKSLFAEAMQSAPDVIREALAELPMQLAEFAAKGKSKITKDASALA